MLQKTYTSGNNFVTQLYNALRSMLTIFCLFTSIYQEKSYASLDHIEKACVSYIKCLR